MLGTGRSKYEVEQSQRLLRVVLFCLQRPQREELNKVMVVLNPLPTPTLTPTMSQVPDSTSDFYLAWDYRNTWCPFGK